MGPYLSPPAVVNPVFLPSMPERGLPKPIAPAHGGMEQLNWGYLELGLFALVFGGLQIWWIGSTPCAAGAWPAR
jgi:hypothetical protein